MAANVDLRRVVKRDGSEQSFDRLRLTDAIAAALKSSGESPVLAQQFVETVWARSANDVGRIESARLAEEVVEAMRLYDCRAAAEAYAWYRMEEEEIVSNLRVFTPKGREAGSAPWDRQRLARSLMRDLYLEGQVARSVSRRVERRLCALGSKHLTGRLVRALCENECRSMGLGGGPWQAENLGIERQQLRAWLGGACLPSGVGAPDLPTLGPQGQDPRPQLGEELLARFALEEVFSAPQLEAWRNGRFDLLALGDWLRPLRIWLHPEPDEDEEAFWKRVAEARLLVHETQVFWPTSKPSGAISRMAPHWLEAPGLRLRLATSDLELAQAWTAAGLWCRMPARTWLAAPKETVTSLEAAGTCLAQWQPPSRFPAQTELSQRQLDQGAAINLVSAAASAGALQVDDFLREVQESLDLACAAMAALCQRAHAGSRPKIHLTPCGVPKALDLLFPDAALRGVRTRRLLLALRDRFERAAKAADLRLDGTCPPHARAAGARLAERSGILGPKDFGCGWMPGPPSVEMLSMALDTAPWLELPARTLLDSPLAGRLSTPPASPSTRGS